MKRTHHAIEAWHDDAHEVANQAQNLLQNFGSFIDGYAMLNDKEDMVQAIADLREAIARHDKSRDEFLLAILAGR